MEHIKHVDSLLGGGLEATRFGLISYQRVVWLTARQAGVPEQGFPGLF